MKIKGYPYLTTGSKEVFILRLNLLRKTVSANVPILSIIAYASNPKLIKI